MAKAASTAPDPIKLIMELGPRTHASTALLLSARLEKTLEWIIQAKMPHLSNTVKRKLFEGYGPFSSLSAKIDVARAFGFIGADDARALHAIRNIRNEFAHADEEIHFHHPSITALIAGLPRRSKKDPFAAFIDIVEECNLALAKRLDAHE